MSEELYIGKPDSPWVDFTENFDYDKVFYDVLLPDGEIVKQCWPNAGWMNAINGDGRKWGGKDGAKVRPSMEHPEDDKLLIVDDGPVIPRKRLLCKPSQMLAIAGSMLGGTFTFGHMLRHVARGESGVAIGGGAEDGKPFKDSRGQTFVRVKGTIRRWKEPKEDGTKTDKPAGTAGPEANGRSAC